MRWKARTSSETWRTTITNVRILNMNIWATCISIREQDRAATRNWLLLADFYQRQQSPSSSWSSHLSLLSPLLFLFHHPPLFIYYPSSSLFTVLIFSSRTYLPSFFTHGCVFQAILKNMTPIAVICITPCSSPYPAQNLYSTLREEPNHWYTHASRNVFITESTASTHTNGNVVSLLSKMSNESNFKASCLYTAGIGMCVCSCDRMHISVLDVSV